MRTKVFTVLLIALFAAAFTVRGTAAPRPEASDELLSLGEKAFQKECSICHGDQGQGNGEAAYLLFPKPRDFTYGTFKVRSTPSGEPPTDQNLFQTITRGLPGSAMPGFSYLSEDERWGLVYHIKKLAEMDYEPESIVEVPGEMERTFGTVAAGRELYRKLKCWECHGEEGKGNGPSAYTAKDDWGFPAPPNDFTRGVYKGGGRDGDIYLRFTTGMDGTPMPSYEASTSSEERWALVHYVKSLAGPGEAVQPSTGDIPVKRITGALPTNPMKPIWDSIEGVSIPLMTLWQRGKAIYNVSVKAVHNGEAITFLLQWEDRIPDMRFIRQQDYPDGAALQFPLTDDRPQFTMGEKGKPVNIWLWKADRQMDLARYQDVEDIYPSMVADDYQLSKGWYPKNIEKAGQVAIASAPAHNSVFLTGWGAGNILSNLWRTIAVEDLNAEGFSTLTAQPPESQDVKGLGFWVNGNWRVQFTRLLDTGYTNDAQMAEGEKIPIAFAVWDGSQQDRDGQKSVSTWYMLNIEE